MIYITQLIYVKQGKESVFHEFEDFAIPLMEKYGGKLVQRIRPTAENFIAGEENRPYEIHFISFESDETFSEFMQNNERLAYVHLKEESVTSSFLVKGKKLS